MIHENHQWLKDIQYLLCEIGCKNVWSNPYTWPKNSLRSNIKIFKNATNILRIQKTQTNVILLKRARKTLRVIGFRYTGYKEKEYVKETHSPYIRSIITRLWIDSNCMLDSYKGKKH